MKSLLTILPLCLSGCQTGQVDRNAPLPIAATPMQPDARTAAVVGHYTLGAYVDPEDVLVRHDAHAIQRVEVPARWDLRTLPVEPPATLDRSPPQLVAPVAADETGARSPVPPPTAPTSAPPPPAIPAAGAPPLETKIVDAPDLPAALAPNADGFIDLTAPVADEDTDLNPFVVRSLRADATREVSVQVSGVLLGAVPCALINGVPVRPGETVESLTLVSLQADAAIFRRDDRLIRLPVAARPAHLRIAL